MPESSKPPRRWLMVVLALGVVGGLVLILLNTSPFDPLPRSEEFTGTVVAISADRNAMGIERDDGTQEGFAMTPETPGADLLVRGAEVHVVVAYLEHGSVLVRAGEAQPAV